MAHTDPADMELRGIMFESVRPSKSHTANTDELTMRNIGTYPLGHSAGKREEEQGVKRISTCPAVSPTSDQPPALLVGDDDARCETSLSLPDQDSEGSCSQLPVFRLGEPEPSPGTHRARSLPTSLRCVQQQNDGLSTPHEHYLLGVTHTQSVLVSPNAASRQPSSMAHGGHHRPVAVQPQSPPRGMHLTDSIGVPSSAGSATPGPSSSAASLSPESTPPQTRRTRVILVKNVPWVVPLRNLREVIFEKVNHLPWEHGKEPARVDRVLPVWDNCMVFVELTREVAFPVHTQKAELRDSAWVDLEPAKKQGVEVPPADSKLQARFIALIGGRDTGRQGTGQRSKIPASEGAKVLDSARLTQQGAARLASFLGTEWTKVVIPPASVRETKQHIAHLRRRYAQLLVQFPDAMTAEAAKERYDGEVISTDGFTFVIRLEFAKKGHMRSLDDERLVVLPEHALMHGGAGGGGVSIFEHDSVGGSQSPPSAVSPAAHPRGSAPPPVPHQLAPPAPQLAPQGLPMQPLLVHSLMQQQYLPPGFPAAQQFAQNASSPFQPIHPAALQQHLRGVQMQQRGAAGMPVSAPQWQMTGMW
eukprot:TRINITY_DN4807_c0_g5_i1.p1 TRINITY_DN4807_c0_g5~~TRINITY_DN4807_c0_g5_i1.p1  ORF type:complete len:588 (+),score=158.92 TRINITY_DN4807_c0_g5_i1:396-2159(+)